MADAPSIAFEDLGEARAPRTDGDAAAHAVFAQRAAARRVAVPTDDLVVQQRLREYDEPITLFGERPPDRRARLLEVIMAQGATGKKARIDDEESDAPRPETPAAPRAGLPEPLALTVAIDTATKIRYPQKRMTLGEMRKRVRNLGEYVTRVQIEAVERAKRVDLLRTVRSEAAPAEQGMPLSMQLVEQLTSDLTAFQRRFMLAGRDDAEDAA